MKFHKHDETLSSSIFETMIATYSEKGYNYYYCDSGGFSAE